MSKVRVVTDSDCDLSAPLLARHDITSLPAQADFDSGKANGPPDTDFMRRTYLELAAGGDRIASIHASSQYRQTAEAARRLADELKGRAEIEVFDTAAVSLAEGLLVLRAALLAETGTGLAQIGNVLHNLIPRTHALIIITDLDYPLRGGRINWFQHLAGKVVGMKPVVGLNANGLVELEGHARSWEKALEELLRLVGERLSYPREQTLGVFHTGLPQEAEALHDQLQAKYEPKEIILAESGAGAAAQLGPGALGVAFFSEKERV